MRKYTTIKCNKCLIEKDLDKFFLRSHGSYRQCCNECWDKIKLLKSQNSVECKICKEIKSPDDCYGRACIPCYNKKRYSEQRESILASSKIWHRKESSHRKRMLYNAKKTATKQNLPFNLELEDIIIPKFCPVLGIEIRFDNEFGDRDSSPSIDRIIPKLGYIKGNVKVISDRANRIKNDGTIEEHEKVIQYIRENTGIKV